MRYLKKYLIKKLPKKIVLLFKAINNKTYYLIYYKSYIPFFHSGKGFQLIKAKISLLYCCEAGILSLDYLATKKKNKTITSCNWNGLESKKIHYCESKKVYTRNYHYLLTKSNSDKTCIWFEYNYISPYGHQKGWKSAHTQIAFIQFLLRLYKYERNEHYIELINKALNLFYIPVEKGGLTVQIRENEWWYMKFATPESKDLRILNSMLFIMVGLYELNEIAEQINHKHIELINKGQKALINCLPVFDSGKWSYYDNYKKHSGNHYHLKHIFLLNKLYELTNIQIYLTYSEAYKNYLATKQ